LVNVVLLVINLVTSPDTLWFYWVTIFWGIAVIFHAATVFMFNHPLFGKKWEEKKTREIMKGD